MNDVSSPAAADPAARVAELEGRGRRFETPCGEGVLVWRRWGSGPPVILAHGSHGSWLHWIRTIDALATERTVWAVDLPGNGESAMPPRPDHAGFAEVMSDGMRRLMAHDLPVDIVGFSFGGVVAACVAEHFPDLVRRIILVDTGGLDTPMGKVKLGRVRGLEGEARKAVHRDNLLGLMLHDPASVDELVLYPQEINGKRGRFNPTQLVLPDKLLDVLSRVSVQMDAIWGEWDLPHPDPAVQEAALRRSHPDLDFRVIPDAGHWVMYERSEAFNAALLDLLRRPLRAKS